MRVMLASIPSAGDDKTVKHFIKNLHLAPTKINSRGGSACYTIENVLGKKCPIERYTEDFKSYGRKAVYITEKLMIDNSDVLIAVYDGKHKPTERVIKAAMTEGLDVLVCNVG